jgi:hypothetical protein
MRCNAGCSSSDRQAWTEKICTTTQWATIIVLPKLEQRLLGVLAEENGRGSCESVKMEAYRLVNVVRWSSEPSELAYSWSCDIPA